MLLSQKIERERKFKLALRASLPPLLLIGLVVYTTFLKDNINFNAETISLILSITFVVIYFVFFIIEISVSEEILDHTTNALNEQAFVEISKKSKANMIGLIEISNLDTIEEFYNIKEIEVMLGTLVAKLNETLNHSDFQNAIIGKKSYNGFLIAVKTYNKNRLHDVIKEFTLENNKINKIDIEYNFAVTNCTKLYDKTIVYLKDIIRIQKNISKNENIENNIKIEEIEQLTLQALEHKNLIFSYKPLLKLDNNSVDIYEVFVKLKANNNDDLLPRFYLPVLNSLGLSREYDLTIAKHIIELLEKIDDSISLAFNLSPFSLRDLGFQKKLLNMIKSSQVNPNRVIIQLYERKTHHDLGGYLKILETLRNTGLRICIDNFGSSNSSMDYLKHFKFDIIQFDREYTQNLYDDKMSSILWSIIEMAKKNSIITMAKWVDKNEQKELLEMFNIDYIQGFTVHKPIYEDELLKNNAKDNL